MKKVIIVIGCFMLSTAFAQTPQTSPIPNHPAGRNFDQAKQKQLERVDQRLARVQQLKSCLQAATGFDAMHQCHGKFEEQHHQ